MATYTVTLTEAQDKALRVFVEDPQDWIEGMTLNRCRIAIDDIYNAEVQRMVDDPTVTSIPADKDSVVLDADVESAYDRRVNAVSPLEVPE